MRIALLLLLAGCDGGSSMTPDAGPGDAGGGEDAEPPEPADDHVFDDTVIRTYDLELPAGDWAWLTENATLETYVPADLVVDGVRYPQVGLRFKGGYGALYSCFDASGARTCPKLSMKVRFDEYVDDQRYFGIRRLQFHSMNKDPAQMREALAYGLFREVGVRAGRAAYARVRVNGEDQGLFLLVEQIDGSYTDRHFDEEGGDGNLYKEVWPGNGVEATYRAALETNEEEADVSGMVAFSAALAGASDATFLDVLGQWTDVDLMFRYLAVDRGISNWDGIIAWYCRGALCGNHNFYWYESETRDRFWLIPWDMDHTFTESPWETFAGVPGFWETPPSCDPIPLAFIPGIGVRAPACDPVLDRLRRLGRDRFVAAARAFLDGPFQEAALLAAIDRYEALLAPEVASDPFGPGAVEWRSAVAELRAAIPMLRARLEEEAR